MAPSRGPSGPRALRFLVNQLAGDAELPLAAKAVEELAPGETQQQIAAKPRPVLSGVAASWLRPVRSSAMGKVFDRIDDRLRDWIARQPMFFVGTAPLAGDGHVNVSPKGPIETLSVLDDHTIAYLDMVGSGTETIAHLRENGRIIVMLCAFAGPPRIVRLHGRGEVVLAGERGFAALLERCGFSLDVIPEARRSVIVVSVERIADSCGYSVPLMRHEGERPHSRAWAAKKLRVGGPEALVEYQREKNAVSIDGLPGAAVEGASPAGAAANRAGPSAAPDGVSPVADGAAA